MFGQNNIIILWGGRLRLSKFGLLWTDKSDKWIVNNSTKLQKDNVIYMDSIP